MGHPDYDRSELPNAFIGVFLENLRLKQENKELRHRSNRDQLKITMLKRRLNQSEAGKQILQRQVEDQQEEIQCLRSMAIEDSTGDIRCPDDFEYWEKLYPDRF